jgi:hypothetical protein
MHMKFRAPGLYCLILDCFARTMSILSFFFFSAVLLGQISQLIPGPGNIIRTTLTVQHFNLLPSSPTFFFYFFVVEMKVLN